MSYSPTPVPPGPEQIPNYLSMELQALAQSLVSAKQFELLQTLNVAPTKPRVGMLVKADGTNWNPGSGAGPYMYVGAAWVPMFGTGTVTHTAGALTAHAVAVGAGSADVAVIAALGTAGWVLTSNGAGADPSFQAAAAGGSTQGKHALSFDAGSMTPSSNNPCGSLSRASTGAGKPDYGYMEFAPSVDSNAEFSFVMPKSWNGGTVTALFHWSHPATTTNFNVYWTVNAVAVGDNVALGTSFGTSQSIQDTGGTTANHYISAETPALTIANSPAGQKRIFFVVTRTGTNGAQDTLAVNARLHGVVVFITTNADTDA